MIKDLGFHLESRVTFEQHIDITDIILISLIAFNVNCLKLFL